jgi:hypothetical protein
MLLLGALMMRSTDPTGPVPAEDENGRLSLTETNANYAFFAFATFTITCIAAGSVVFWYLYLFQHGAPQITSQKLRIFGFICIVLVPFVPVCYLNLIYPPLLTIDDDGLNYRNLGKFKRIRWADIEAIDLKLIVNGRTRTTTTQTVIKAAGQRVAWMPVFGIAPAALAAYLNQRRAKLAPGLALTVNDTTSKAMRKLGVAMGTANKVLLYLMLSTLAAAVIVLFVLKPK